MATRLVPRHLYKLWQIANDFDADLEVAYPLGFTLPLFWQHPPIPLGVSEFDVANTSDFEWTITTRFQANEDLIVIENALGSAFDSSADQETGLTTKMGIDATEPSTKPKEKFERVKFPRANFG